MTEPMYLAYGDDGGTFYIGPAGLEAYGPDILKPPHLVKLPPQPEPEPLTEDELAAFERWLATTAADERSYLEEEAIPALIAEVRRLRAKVPYNGQGFVNSAGQYVDADGRAHLIGESKRPRQYSDLSDWEKLFAPASLDW